jgi:hypothetical protein
MNVLIVAHRTAATPRLLDAVREKAAGGDCSFTLLVPREYWDPDTERAATVLELALPLLDEASGTSVDGIIGASDPFEAVKEALATHHFDEVIVSTLPHRISAWLHVDLPSRVEKLGLPVTTVTATSRQEAVP